MKHKALMSLVVILGSLSLSSVSASPKVKKVKYAKVSSITKATIGKLLVGQIIDYIKEAIAEIIEELEHSATTTAFALASNLRVLLDNLDYVASGILDKTFQDLDSSQQKLFLNALHVIEVTDAKIDAKIKKIRQLVSQTGVEISRLPMAEKRPLVTGISPGYFLAGAKTVDINVSGSRLNSKSTMFLGAKQCSKLKSHEIGQTYRCNVSGQSLSGYLNYFYKKKKYTYQLSVAYLPMEWGQYTLTTYRIEKSVRRVNRTAYNQYHNAHCARNRRRTWSYAPAHGCYIDVTSIKPTCHRSSRSRCEGLVNVTSRGFQYKGHIRNRGSCTLGLRTDARGSVRVYMSWIDICPAPDKIVTTTKRGVLQRNRDVVLMLPERLRNYVLTVKPTYGKSIGITGQYDDGVFQVLKDSKSKSITIRRKAP